jgi:hypothetical protein
MLHLYSGSATNFSLPTAFTFRFINSRSNSIFRYNTFAYVAGRCFRSSAIDTPKLQNATWDFTISHIETSIFPDVFTGCDLAEIAEFATV